MGRDLPAWPMAVMGAAFPLLWVVGFGFLFPALVGLVVALVLLRRRWLLVPRGWYLWFAYLAFVMASLTQVDSAGQAIGFVFRLLIVLSGTVLLLYIFSATETSLTIFHVYAGMAGYWAFVIVGGWLGILAPMVVISTPAATILPGTVTANELVQSMVTLHFAEVQQPWGADEPFARPAAPFPASNGWGTNFALLLPMMAQFATMLRGAKRWLFVLFSLSGFIPAFATLNRGMLIGVAVGIGYGTVFALAQRRFRAAMVVGLAAVVGVVVATAAGFFASIAERTQVSDSTEGRADIYAEAFERTLESPILGYGAPRASQLLEISVGTQGQAWNVMFSHGFIALGLYVAFMGWVLWASRHARPPADAAHISVMVGAVLFWIYGFGGPQFLVLMAAAGVALRDSQLRLWRHRWALRDPLGRRPEIPQVAVTAS